MTDTPTEQAYTSAADTADPKHGTPISGLLVQLSNQFTGLIREEIALAKADAKEKVAIKGKAIAMFAVGGVVALYAVGALIATLIIVIAIWLPLWAAATIITGTLLLITGIFVLAGVRGIKKDPTAGEPGLGDRVKADVEVLKSGGDDNE